MANNSCLNWTRCGLVSVLMGAYLASLLTSIGIIWGNLATYVISYFYFRVKDDIGDRSSWVTSASVIGIGLGMTSCERITRTIGQKHTMIFGSLLFTGAALLSFVTVQYSLAGFVISYGLLAGMSYGITNGALIMILVGWTPPRYVGITCTSVFACIYLGGAVFDLVVIWFINPDNLSPDAPHENQKLFSQQRVLNRVPYLFILHGLLNLTLSVTSFGLVRQRPLDDESSQDNSRANRDGSRSDDDLVNSLEKLNSFEKTNMVSRPEDRKSLIESFNSRLSFEMTEETTHLLQKQALVNQDRGLSNTNKAISNDTSLYNDVTPKEALKTKTFYALYVFCFCAEADFMTLGSYFKVFGMYHYPNDQFFTNLAMGVSLGAALFTFFGGIACDTFGIKNTVLGSTAVSCISISFLYVSVRVSHWLYAFLAVVSVGLVFGNVILPSVCCVHYFGKKYGTTMYGLLMTSALLSNTAMPFLIQYILSVWGWFQLFLCLGILTLISLLALITLPEPSQNY